MNVRTKGLLKVLGSGFAFAAVFLTVLENGLGDPSVGGPFKLIAMGLPGAFTLVGLIELLTGIEFTHISSKWDPLHGWQRGILGLLIVALAIVLLFAGLYLFA